MVRQRCLVQIRPEKRYQIFTTKTQGTRGEYNIMCFFGGGSSKPADPPPPAKPPREMNTRAAPSPAAAPGSSSSNTGSSSSTERKTGRKMLRIPLMPSNNSGVQIPN